MTKPTIWSTEDLLKDAAESREIFRSERIGEPLQLYTEFFDEFQKVFTDLIDKLDDISADPVDHKLLSQLVTGKNNKKAFRYLAAPPISEDDLKALADASFGPKIFKNDPDAAKRVRDVVLSVLDPYRFPWVVQKRAATANEIDAAVVASAALAAAKEVETKRRNSSKDVQETAVKDVLRGAGFVEVAKRNIPMLTEAPNRGEFCGESAIAGTRADVVVRLRDGRVLAIECKVSNSAVNSYKRLIHEASGKATTWYRQLGEAQVVPAAVLSGIYAPSNLEKAQNEKACFLFWQHRLSDLAKFVSQ